MKKDLKYKKDQMILGTRNKCSVIGRSIALGNKDAYKTTLMVVLLLGVLFGFNTVSAKAIIQSNNTDSPWGIIANDSSYNTYVEKDFKLGVFHGVDISGNIELVLTQDALQSVRVSATEKLMPDMVVKVEKGILKVYSQAVFFNKRIKLYVSTDSITFIKVRGACKVSNVEKMTSTNLSIDISGACKLELNIDIENTVDIKSNGATFCDIDGKTNKLFVNMNGAAKLEADELIAKHVEVEVRGASSAWVYASEFVDIVASGASKVTCDGNPQSSKLNAGTATKIDIR